MHFLQGRSGTRSSCLSYKIYTFIKHVTTKRMVSMTFDVAMASSFLFSIDLLHLHCPRHNSPGVSAVIKGSSPLPLLKKQGLPTACKRIPALIPQAVVIKPPWNQDGRLKTGPLGSCHGGAPSPRRSCGWFVKTELDFKQGWDKYYLFFSKALISALEIVQPFNGSLSSVPYKDFV